MLCNLYFQDATVRVWVQDKDSINANDIIGRFNCEISREPDSSERLSTWHNGNCVPVSKTQGDKIRYALKQIRKSSRDLRKSAKVER